MPISNSIEVPGYVQHEQQIVNKVQVQGGTNWDLSRSAVTTPITPVAEPTPVYVAPPLEAPEERVAAVVAFPGSKTKVAAAAKKTLKNLPQNREYSVRVTPNQGAKSNAALNALRKQNIENALPKKASVSKPTSSLVKKQSDFSATAVITEAQ